MEMADENAMRHVAEVARELDRYLRHLAIERGLSVNTVSAYRRDLTAFLQSLAAVGVAQVAELTPENVRGYVVSLREGERPLSPATPRRDGRSA